MTTTELTLDPQTVYDLETKARHVVANAKTIAEREHALADPVWFLEDVLGCRNVFDKQLDILRSVQANRRTAVVGANSSGKDYASGRILLWWEYAHEQAVTVVYGPTMRQVRDIIWVEARRGYASALTRLPGYMYPQAPKYRINDYRYAEGFSADPKDDTGSGIQGFHSPHLLVIVTEAHAVRQDEIDALMRLNPERILLTGNPLCTGGEFYEAFHGQANLYHTITIGAKDTPNIQQGRIVIPGMLTVEDVEDRARRYGEDSPYYRASVKAEFSAEANDSLVPLGKVLAAIERTIGEQCNDCDHDEDDHDDQGACVIDGCSCDHIVRPQGGAILGVDVARSGPDYTVIYRRKGPVARMVWSAPKNDLMELVGRIGLIVADDPDIDTVVIDDTGMGGGVTDRLREINLRAAVVPFTAGASADDKGRFFNQAAEAAWHMREAFMDDRLDVDDNQVLVAELTTRRYSVQSDRTIKLESKQDMQKRLRKSPDHADALAMTFTGEGHGPNIRFI